MIKKYFQDLPINVYLLLLLALAISSLQLFQQYLQFLSTGLDYGFSLVPIGKKIVINNVVWVLLIPFLFVRLTKITDSFGLIFRKNKTQLLLLIIIPLFHRSLVVLFQNGIYFLQSGYMRSFFSPNNINELTTGAFTSVVECIIISGILLVLNYQQKLANKESDLVQAQLDALRMQLQPHFLFNTLHSISSMMDIDKKRAQKMITHLGDLFRMLLEYDKQDRISITEEIEFVRRYLELEQIRFQDRMDLDINIEEAVADAQMPTMILQPLIENCIKHGVARNPGKNKIQLSIGITENNSKRKYLKIQLQNSTTNGQEHNQTSGFGIGQKNVIKRLKQNFSKDFNASFQELEKDLYVSELIIPLKYD